MQPRFIGIVLSLFLVLLLAGCGSSSTSNTPTTSPQPTAAVPPGGGTGSTGSGTGGTGTGGGPTLSSAPDDYMATEFLENGSLRMAVGQLNVDVSANDGAGSARGDSGLSTKQKLQFCPYLGALANCFDVASFTLDSQGLFNFNFTFPNRGAQFGIFRTVADPAGFETANFGAGVATQTTSPSFRATLLPAGMVSGGVGENIGTASLQHGTVTVTGVSTGNQTFVNSVQISLSGVPASDAFTAKYCTVTGPSRCVFLGSFSSDASGNASATLSTTGDSLPVLFLVSDSRGVEYVTGFRVE